MLVLIILVLVGASRDSTSRRARQVEAVGQQQTLPAGQQSSGPAAQTEIAVTPEEREAQGDTTRDEVDQRINQGRRTFGDLDEYLRRKAKSDEAEAKRICQAVRRNVAKKRILDLTVEEADLLSRCAVLEF